jgi:N-acetylmuramoyl-L-alanine amidase
MLSPIVNGDNGRKLGKPKAGATLSKSARKKSPIALKTIIIDPGHGGRDPGAAGLISTEAQISLDISLKLGKVLETEFPQLKIVYTRTTDVLPGNVGSKDDALRLRAQIANEAKGDLFISIHCNSAGRRPGGWYERRVVGYNKRTIKVKQRRKWVKKTVSDPIYKNFWVENVAKGTETYIWSAGKNDDKANQINQMEEETGEENDSTSTFIRDLNSPEAKLRAQLYTKMYFKNSALFGNLVEQEFRKAGRASHGGLKQRNHTGIWVLQATGMPSVLIETGFISNKEEEEYLVSENGQAEIVSNIMDAFRQYKTLVENPVKSGSGSGGVPTNGIQQPSAAKK